uniref:Ribosomal protein S3 n=1 Tax=Analipus japonicus TaxID=31333 RepID=A0A8F0FDK8_9PHAE|nr:ribosomal protein S3 [Analipus japonicus]
MAQKAHPTSLRPIEPLYQGATHWDEARFYYILSMIHKLLGACCSGTNHYLDRIRISRHLGLVLVETDLVHLHDRSKRPFKSRRYKENTLKLKRHSWTMVACRLYSAAGLIQRFTGTKRVIIRINRLKTYTRAIPSPARCQIAYYAKSFHNLRYVYARYGMQLLFLVVQDKASVTSLSKYIVQNICTRKKKKRHNEFLNFLKRALESLREYQKIQGLKIQLKGRFTHKAKGRSRVWKYQMGRMPLSQLDKPIETEYLQTQTGYGGVGIKVWICRSEKAYDQI